ncbi:unnamed protein product [Penicillium salamii]|uniref:FAD/NAD(P)-binding domain-containing protein n=1 Tax=Penicillium salamii TaxID=1612424 RepID=A0A9W4JBJ6_9EURO|nr:unnamed protein product [Penicillium salamii]
MKMFVSLTPPTINEISTNPKATKQDSVMSRIEGTATPESEKTLPVPTDLPTEEKHKAYTPLISERAIDQARPLKVIYIGAGISGILAAIKFREAVPDLSLTIYEKNPELGGTWYENQYPGCACDVPSHSYQLSFESWTGWSKFFSGADEIREYWNRVALKYNVREHIKFESRCVGARWNDSTGKWFVQVVDEKTGSVFEDSADIFMTGTGLLNEWKWPPIPGLHTFKGKLLHSASWDSTYDMTNKEIAVIGAGSSGIQIVPALLENVNGMDHYKQFWQDNPAAYVEYRKGLELELQTLYSKSQRSSDLQRSSRVQYQADMQRRLKEKPELLADLLPDFPPLCKRLTPGPGYLEALTSPKVRVITTAIKAIDESGVVTSCGTHRAVDAIVCATGFETNPGGGFPIIGRNGVNLRKKYSERPESYLGITTNDFPNFFQSLGPNSFQGAGNLLITMEQVHAYVAQIIARMAYDNIGIVEAKKSQVRGFTQFCEKYFERTVYSAKCASWYKSSPPGSSLEERKSGRVVALWPGSSLHALQALKKVRWEDYDLQSYDGNEFGWFGNGWIFDEQKLQIDGAAITHYLDRTDFLGAVDTKIGSEV